MIKTIVAAVSLAAVCLPGFANAADVKAKPAVVAAPVVVPVQDCSAFYDDYARRGFTWGVGPGLGVGFGTLEGALPRYPLNEFPNWYGLCEQWGRYSAAGAARW